MGAIDQEPTSIDGDAPGVTFTVYPYESGCDVDPGTKVNVDVLADRGDGLGRQIRVSSSIVK